MLQRSAPATRPIWLVGGLIGLGVLGFCALISVCSATALLWFSNQRSINTARETQVVVQHQVVSAATAAPTLVMPTPQPPITALPPIEVSMPTLIPSPQMAPDQAVRNYYQLVSQKRYDLTWPMLTDAFKQKFNCCAPNYNYTGYVNWWNSVNHVDFGSVIIVSENGGRAVVYAELYYVMNTGTRSSVDGDPYIALVYDDAAGVWRFDDKRAAP